MIHWLDDEAYEKVEGSARLKMGAILGVFDTYGMGAYLPEVIEQVMQVVIWYGLKVRGVEKPPPNLVLRER